VPFLTIILFEDWCRENPAREYLTFSLSCVANYLPMPAWFSLWIGLRLRSQLRAIVVAVSLLAGWVMVPMALRYLLTVGLGMRLTGAARYLFVLSPADMICAIETSRPSAYGFTEPAWVCYVLNLPFYACLLFVFHHLCLRNADAHLGRIPVENVARKVRRIC